LQEQENAAAQAAAQQAIGGEGDEEYMKGGGGGHYHPASHHHPSGESSSSSLTHHQSQQPNHQQPPNHHRKTITAESHPHHNTTSTLELPSINKKDFESTTTATTTTTAEDTRKLMDYNSEDDDYYNYYDDYYYDNNNDFAERKHHQTSSAAASYNRLYPTTDDDRITWSRLVTFSLSLLFLLHITYYLWIDVWGGNQLGAVFGFYGVVTTVIAAPLSSTRWLRKATVLVLQRSFELINPRCWCLVSPSSTTSSSLSEVPPLYPNGKQQQQQQPPASYQQQHQHILRGPRPIPFVDVFFADAMCSLSKVFFDWGMLLVMASHYPYPVPATTQNIVIPSLCAAIPFCIRARQCLIMYQHGAVRHDPKRFSHLWNALKYSTSIFPLIVSVIQKTVLENNHPKQAKALEKYLILLLVINALYALYWDIVMDWGMMQNPSAAAAVAAVGCCGSSMSGTGGLCAIGSCGSCCSSCCRRRSCICCGGKHASVTVPSSTLSSSAVAGSGVGGGASGKPLRAGKSSNSASTTTMNCWYAWLRPRLRFGIAMSAMIVLADCILRFGWTLRFYKRLFPSGDSFVLCTQFLEVFRRAIWNLLRVEWENSKQAKAKSQASLASSNTPGPSSTTTGGTASPTTMTTASSSSVSGVGGSSNNNGVSSSSSMTGVAIGPLSSLTAVATSSVRHLVPSIVDDNETGSGSSSNRAHEMASLVTASAHPKVATA